ncbi:AtpZ/AtpI family protein [Sandaracinobacter sp. RS1-74]|uniref:AtpZ/AtpI family protein n=1 Tax=Sandaracinobacteroides sayramensis TaxID=2913411 RepID=UPI001EDC7AB8|nr:AtpZ/AtpI family protein [Sandaracinobacteroides sayramensis]MCG2840280.1 AtpZ/AtpI family protein [Sandaracinobacteroides sayramensis]
MADLFEREGPTFLPDPADKRDLEDLGARLEAAKARHEPRARQAASSALAQGTRHAFEIAATTLVGGGIGWMLDRWLETGPWMLLLFFLLGIAAGFWNLLKAVGNEAKAVRKAADEPKNDDQV